MGLLEDAFVGTAPRDDFNNLSGSRYDESFADNVAANEKDFLLTLIRASDAAQLPESSDRVPYWSARNSAKMPGRIPLDVVTREFCQIVTFLDLKGYFEQAFDKDCIDAPSDVVPADVFETMLGTRVAWPLSAVDLLMENPDILFDVMEALYDLVARPRHRWLHSYAGCGWHHSDFSLASGRTIYAWRVNRLLARSDLGMSLETEGELSGRLVTTTDDARSDLLKAMNERADSETGDRVRHAIALFRARSATEHEKRSAAFVLYLVLEERRPLLKKSLLSKDEGALFQIANEFAVRHQDRKQQGDYDPIFRDWIFWWYLATIELTDRLINRAQ